MTTTATAKTQTNGQPAAGASPREDSRPEASLLDQVVQETQKKPTALQFVGKLDEFWRLANMLANSGMTPYRRPEACMAILLRAHELGISTSMAFSLIYHFDGQTHMAAGLITALAIARCGVKYEISVWDENICRLKFTRPDWEPIEVEFTIADAERAGLAGKPDEKTGVRPVVGKKHNWKNYPKAMLLARTQAMGVRAIAPDYFAGEYAAEEFDIDTRRPPREMPANARAAMQRAAGADADGSDRLAAVTSDAGEPHPLEAVCRRAMELAEVDSTKINQLLAEFTDREVELGGEIEKKYPDAWKQALGEAQEAETAAGSDGQPENGEDLNLFGS